MVQGVVGFLCWLLAAAIIAYLKTKESAGH